MFSSSLQSWLSHEVEVLVSVGQARQTLESLIEDRKALSRQLAELRTQEQDEDDEPAAKVLSFVCLSVCHCFVAWCFHVSANTVCSISLKFYRPKYQTGHSPVCFLTSFLVK